ncbi:hypothetical protein [Pleomorphovibrio marinus]|uniref:hypothetical protein n=1 Tax=Pleomorphovibrio marinus TaxID=2164132 RepID=UPI00130088D6|nr:hypothetical protein [Pleomorphovibrio marinus]
MTGLFTDMDQYARVRHEYGVPKVMWCYWSGGEMVKSRKKSFECLIKHIGIPVFLVNKRNFRRLEVSDIPIHPAFELLSAVHQSDYVRAYLWHFYGGAWHDIKATKVSFSKSWANFKDPEVYLVGRPEYPNGPARVLDNRGRWMPDYWKDLVSVIAWIGRPQTPFSEEVLKNFHFILDQHIDLLRKNPGRHPREKRIEPLHGLRRQLIKVSYYFRGRDVAYPLPWTLFGNIFHPLNLQFHSHVLKGLPHDKVKNAGMYHR